MKTKTRKTTRILCASTLAAMTLLGSAAPALTTVMADGTTPKTPVDSKNLITFHKKIILDKGENVPNVTIKYALTSNEDTSNVKTHGFGEAKAGDVKKLKISDDSSTTFSVNDDNGIKEKDGKRYIDKTATIDASGLLTGDDKATKPTVYTYTLSESAEKADGSKADFMTLEGAKKLNVYVGYAQNTDGSYSNELSVLGATLYGDGDDTNYANKTAGFENNYNTNSDPDPDDPGKTKSIRVTKKVTGNQGDKTKKFHFTVTINGQYSNVTATTTGDEKDLTSTAPSKENENTVVKVYVDLKDGETLTLNGLTKGSTYKVEENDYRLEGYTADYHGETGFITTDNDHQTTVTNTKSGTIPTGIYLNHKLPFNVLGVALAGGAVALIAKKRHEALEDEDDE